MVARLTAASLGLFAFAVTALSGLFVQNPVTVTLSRSILALFVFCLIGFVLGGAAQYVIAEHEKRQEEEIRVKYREQDAPEDSTDTDESTPAKGEAVGAA